MLIDGRERVFMGALRSAQTINIGVMNSTLIERGPQFFTDGPVTVAIGRATAITTGRCLDT